jgi:tripartite-type tricarboxylate transporter receptor subunit TctC
VRQIRLSLIALSILMLSSVRNEAQWLPDTTVRIVVPFAAGGPGDIVMRLLAEQVMEKTKQKIVVEVRPGGGSIIGTEAVARSLPDGSTLLLVANSFLINASLRSGLAYDPLTSFTPVCLLAHSPMVFAVNASSNYQSLEQFMAAARDLQSALSVGATGPGTAQQIAIEALKQAGHARLIFVPFSGGPPAVSSLLGNHITAVLANYADVRAHLGTALRPLAVGSPNRLSDLPNVPTFSESGFDEIDGVAWMGLVLPARTPETVVSHVAANFRAALDVPAVAARLKTLEITPAGRCGADFAAFLRRQHDRTARTVKAANLKAE